MYAKNAQTILYSKLVIQYSNVNCAIHTSLKYNVLMHMDTI